jgi:hypothetical protein
VLSWLSLGNGRSRLRHRVVRMSVSTHLFPVQHFLNGFTSSPVHLPHLVHVSLEDDELGIHKRTKRTKYPLVVPPLAPAVDPSVPPPGLAWEAFYPEGSIDPKGDRPGGFGFYLSGPPGFSERLADANEVVFSYRMMLQEGWEWMKGGKLPGICRYRISIVYVSPINSRWRRRRPCLSLLWRAPTRQVQVLEFTTHVEVCLFSFPNLPH